MLATPDEWPAYVATPAPSNAGTLLAAASAQVRNYCGWSIARQTVTSEVLDGDGGWVLRLPTLHLVSVTEVLIDNVAVDDFLISAKGMLDRRPRTWPEGFGRIKASYVHGHNPVPADVKAVVVAVAARSAEDLSALESRTVGRITDVFRKDDSPSGLNRYDRLALDSYRLERI